MGPGVGPGTDFGRCFRERGVEMEGIKIRDLKMGEFFTLRPVEHPKDSQVYIRGVYDRSEKKYDCVRFDDISYSRQFKGDKIVYTEFVF